MPSSEDPVISAARRDPEGRKRRIEQAAADLLLETGGGAITHRQVAARAGVALGSTTRYFATLDDLREAALRNLTDETELDLAVVEQTLANEGATPQVLAASIYAFHSEGERVRRAVALLSAAAQNADARRLASHWFNQYVEVLSRYIDPERAVLLAVFVDGVTVHASMRDQPLSEEALIRAVSAIVGEPQGATRPPGP